MDELLLALYRRSADQVAERHAAALASDRPLHALWALVSDSRRTALALEFMALATHRSSIRAEIAAYLSQSRRTESDAIARVLAAKKIDAARMPPAAIGLLLGGIGRALVTERNMGVGDGHDEVRALVEAWLASVEPTAEGQGAAGDG